MGFIWGSYALVKDLVQVIAWNSFVVSGFPGWWKILICWDNAYNCAQAKITDLQFDAHPWPGQLRKTLHGRLTGWKRYIDSWLTHPKQMHLWIPFLLFAFLPLALLCWLFNIFLSIEGAMCAKIPEPGTVQNQECILKRQFSVASPSIYDILDYTLKFIVTNGCKKWNLKFRSSCNLSSKRTSCLAFLTSYCTLKSRRHYIHQCPIAVLQAVELLEKSILQSVTDPLFSFDILFYFLYF